MSGKLTYIFVVGSPRSGTTILSEVLGRHPDIADFYEPYYIWDYRTGSGNDDVRTAAIADASTRALIRREFELFAKKSRKSVVVEKSPENCFRVPYVHAVFPEAKWIHIIRDGRDCVESIYRESEKRKQIVQERNIKQLFGVAYEMLRVQRFWRNRWQALWFELREIKSFDPRRYFNKAKWEGGAGWGPRFRGWRDARRQLEPVAFAALQWRTSVESLMNGLQQVPPEQQINCRYEDFVAHPEPELERLFDFIGVAPMPQIARDITQHSIGKWRHAFTPRELGVIGPVIGDLMVQLRQTQNLSWYLHSGGGA